MSLGGDPRILFKVGGCLTNLKGKAHKIPSKVQILSSAPLCVSFDFNNLIFLLSFQAYLFVHKKFHQFYLYIFYTIDLSISSFVL